LIGKWHLGSLPKYGPLRSAEMVTRMDMQIGRVLKALDAHKLARNTIVVFTSDNGGERFSDTWRFSGKKTELLEGGIRVPAIVHWPAQVRTGIPHNQVITSTDWLPTFLAAAGGEPDPNHPSDGMNLLNTLGNNAAPRIDSVCRKRHAQPQGADK
jgi:arylsulfatase A-like enzyme